MAESNHLSGSLFSNSVTLLAFRLTQSSPGGTRAPGRTNLGGGTAFRGNLWSSTEALLVQLSQMVGQIAGLEAVMAKRKDANSHETFQQIYASTPALELSIGVFLG